MRPRDRTSPARNMHTTPFKSEVADGLRIDWDVPIVMDDGIILRADVFRPNDDGRYPVILSHGPYGKGLAFQDGWKNAIEVRPDIAQGRQYYEGPFFNCTVDPVEISWTVHDLSVADRQGGLVGQNNMQFQQVVNAQARLQTSPDSTQKYDPTVVANEISKK